jgi:hypothetical protein
MKYDKKAEAKIVQRAIVLNHRITPEQLYDLLGHGPNRLSPWNKVCYIKRLGFMCEGRWYEGKPGDLTPVITKEQSK